MRELPYRTLTGEKHFAVGSERMGESNLSIIHTLKINFQIS